MNIKDSVEQMTLSLFQNCDVPDNFGSRVLNDDAFGRSRYERLYSVRSNYARENMYSKTFTRVQSSGEVSRVKLRRLLTQEHISKNIPKSSKIHDYITVDC